MKSSTNPINHPQTFLRGAAAEARRSQKAAGGSIADTMTGWTAAQFACFTRQKLDAAADDAARWDLLRASLLDWVRLRRSDRAADRVAIAREHLELKWTNNEAEKEKEFRQWLKRPDIQKELFPDKKGGLSKETIELMERELNLL